MPPEALLPARGPGQRRLPDRLASPRAGAAALAFVMLSLAVLVLVPVVVQREAARVRAELDEVVNPARTRVARIQGALAQEQAAIRGYLMTGDQGFLRRFGELTEAETRAYAELGELTRHLDPETIERFATLRTLSGQWHELAMQIGLDARAAPDEDVVPRRLGGGSLFEEVLTAAQALEAELTLAVRERRAALRRMERLNVQLTGALSGVALVSVLLLAWTGRRMRALADAAEDRRHEAEEALAELRRGAASRARLLQGITHDVKNPLGAADGYAELLEMGLRGPLTPAQAQLVEGVRRSVHAALAIIHELLDLSRAESGRLSIQRAPTALQAVIREAVEDHGRAAEVEGHTLEACLEDEIPDVYTDEARVRQVLGNLLLNAIKYTPPPGRITVRARRVEGGEQPRPGAWVAVEVADDGPGIPEEEQEAIFLEFQRGSTARNAGHGLGLAISRRIARLLGGDLVVESASGAGTCFTLWLPMRTGGPGDTPAHEGAA